MKMLLVALMLTLATGCTTLGKLITPTTVEIAQIAIDTAVGAILGPDTLAAQAKALAIKDVATQLLAVDTGSSAAIGALSAALDAKLATMHFANPDEAIAAQSLLLIVNQTATNLIGKSPTSTSTVPSTAATAQVAIATVLQQIVNATAAYGV